MSKGYCVKCNRGRKKGEWEPVELLDERIEVIKTSRGPKKFLFGKCPKCNNKVTVIIGK